VKPETVQFIAYARKLLADATIMIQSGLNDHAARTAYLACFHAARAYTFERGGQLAKTHRGVQTEFFRLSKDDDRSSPELRAFLTRAYTYKSSADYETGPEDETGPVEAQEAVEIARRFVAEFAVLAATPPATRDAENEPGA
jgi:uncharacterized protein (UPF0332 family)